MKIAIRMDDITPDMDFEKFYKFKAILDKHDIKPLIGVVPDNKDKKLQKSAPREDFWEYIRGLQQKGWVIAMHGYNHVYTTREPGMFPIGDKSEFAGVAYPKQDEMIREGKRILKSHGIITDFFMAPSHSYDKNTLRALKVNGFYRITDGFGTSPYKKDGITFYPIAISRSKALSSNEEGIVTFVYHAGTMSNRDFDNLEKLFDRAEVVSYDEFMHYDTKVLGLKEEAQEFMTAKAKYYAVRLKRNLSKK